MAITEHVTKISLPLCSMRIANPKPQCSHQSMLRSAAGLIPETLSGIFSEKCIFCPPTAPTTKQVKYGHEKPVTCKTLTSETSIKYAAKVLNDSNLLTAIGDVEFIAKEVKYHPSCRKAYLARADYKEKQNIIPISSLSSAHDDAFASMQPVIEMIIKNNSAVMLCTMHIYYIKVLAEHGVETSYDTQSLKEKLLEAYPDSIVIDKITNKLGLVVFSNELTIQEAYDIAQDKTAPE